MWGHIQSDNNLKWMFLWTWTVKWLWLMIWLWRENNRSHYRFRTHRTLKNTEHWTHENIIQLQRTVIPMARKSNNILFGVSNKVVQFLRHKNYSNVNFKKCIPSQEKETQSRKSIKFIAAHNYSIFFYCWIVYWIRHHGTGKIEHWESYHKFASFIKYTLTHKWIELSNSINPMISSVWARSFYGFLVAHFYVCGGF